MIRFRLDPSSATLATDLTNAVKIFNSSGSTQSPVNWYYFNDTVTGPWQIVGIVDYVAAQPKPELCIVTVQGSSITPTGSGVKAIPFPTASLPSGAMAMGGMFSVAQAAS